MHTVALLRAHLSLGDVSCLTGHVSILFLGEHLRGGRGLEKLLKTGGERGREGANERIREKGAGLQQESRKKKEDESFAVSLVKVGCEVLGGCGQQSVVESSDPLLSSSPRLPPNVRLPYPGGAVVESTAINCPIIDTAACSTSWEK